MQLIPLTRQVSAERDRLRKQRDELSKQFEDLTRLRNTETEKLFERYRETAETAARGQLSRPAFQAA